MIQPWLVRDRERFGFSAAQVAGHLGVTRQECLELGAGTHWPSSTVWERMVECTAGRSRAPWGCVWRATDTFGGPFILVVVIR